MRMFATISLLLCVTTTVRAQISVEEAKVRLAERQKLRQQQAATQPTTESTAKTPMKKVKKLVLKDGAPESVQMFFNQLPTYKRLAVEQIEAEIKKEEADINNLQHSPLPQVVVGRNLAGGEEYANDERAAKARSNQTREMRLAVVKLKKAIKQINEDQTFIYIPPLELTPEKYGRMDGMKFKISQISDGQNMLVRWGEDTRVWLKGFSTKNLADDQIIELDEIGICTGTKRYMSVLGATQTVLCVEPLPLDKWIETVEVEVPVR